MKSDTSEEATKWCLTVNFPWSNDNILLYFYSGTVNYLMKLPMDLSTIYWNLEFPATDGKASCLHIDTEINKIFIVSLDTPNVNTFTN